jgi:hypothetical protein
MTASIL